MPETLERPLATLQRLLAYCFQYGASDLHLTADERPYVRTAKGLQPLDSGPVAEGTLERIVADLLSESQSHTFQREHSVDLGLSDDDGHRFRLNIVQQSGKLAIAARRLAANQKTIGQLKLPSALKNIAEASDGLVLVTGPTGSGKSTTLAGMIHHINLCKPSHIITVEDPIEYVHSNDRSLVHQRELHTDVPTFAAAVRAALREDPDVILVGEMRDQETIRTAMTAAETGHLVFSTLHTSDAAGTVGRIINAFPADQHLDIRSQLANVLRAIISQTLVAHQNGNERIPVVEVMTVNSAVANLIRSNDPHQLPNVMQTSTDDGMILQEQSLAELTANGDLDINVAEAIARNANIFASRLSLLSAEWCSASPSH